MAILGLLLAWMIPGIVIGAIDIQLMRRTQYVNRVYALDCVHGSHDVEQGNSDEQVGSATYQSDSIRLHWLQYVGKIAGAIIAVDLLTMLAMHVIAHRVDYTIVSSYHVTYILCFIVAALALGVVLLVVKYGVLRLLSILSHGRLQLRIRQHIVYPPLRIAVLVGIILLALIGLVLGLGAWWYKDFIGDLTPEQMMFNFFASVAGGENGAVNDIFARPVLYACCIMAVLLYLMCTPVSYVWKDADTSVRTVLHNSVFKGVAAVLALAIAIVGTLYSWTSMHLNKVVDAYFVPSMYIADHYVQPSSKLLTVPEHKRNLIHIYFESAENSYLDKSHGGYQQVNLMPDLMHLADEGGVHFSHTDTFGGPHQIYGSSWSSAGMTNMTFGVPAKMPSGGATYGLDGKYLPGAVGYTDLLHEQGYNEEAIFGSDADFGGLTQLFGTHGVQTMFDLNYAKRKGLLPPHYKVWWGFEDNKLYAYAKDQITRLAGEHKPFAFIMENADSHFPDGYMEPETQRRFSSQYANVIFHSQQQIVDFIRWVQRQPFYPDTTIVVTGDHRSMDKKFFAGWDPHYERTIFNMFINARFNEHQGVMNVGLRTAHRDFAPFDMYPTIMAALGYGITGNRLALGTNLASSQQTLLERDGVAHVDYQLSLYSKFYEQHLLK